MLLVLQDVVDSRRPLCWLAADHLIRGSCPADARPTRLLEGVGEEQQTASSYIDQSD
jgi:hypothetical protein